MTISRITQPAILWPLLATTLMACTPAWALYKVVGADGQVTYSDRPPVDAKAQTIKSGSAGTPSTDGLPYELQKVVTRYPVVFYSSAACSPCDSGRLYLVRRGIPFSEKTVNTNEDLRAFKNTIGTDQLPALKIGSQQIVGFSDSEWSEYLNAAGYPERSTLPAGYKSPAATPLTTMAPAREAPTPSSATPSPSPAQPSGNAPPGFRF